MDIQDLKQVFDAHTADEMRRYDLIQEKLDLLANNHLGHVQSTLTSIETQLKPIVLDHPTILATLTSLKERMQMISWVGGIIGTAIILGLTAALMALILK